MWSKVAIYGAKLLKNKNTRNIILSLLLVIPMIASMLFSLPVFIFSMPKHSFLEDSEQKEYYDEYVDILVEYKGKIHRTINSKKTEYVMNNNTNNSNISVAITYPSLSVLIAYDNVINKEEYFSEEKPEKIDKSEINKFLDSVMLYKIEGSVLKALVKTSEEVALYFEDEEDRKMFEYTYESLLKTDLDNSVPDVSFEEFEYAEGGIKLPYLSQLDPRWKLSPYGDSTVGASGCAIASTCMVINGLKPETQIMPDSLALWSYKKGYYVSGVGTAWSFFPSVAKEYDLKLTTLSRNSPQLILDELTKGNPIVVSMSEGHFTRGGHMIVLRGINEEGKIIVSDPSSKERTNTSWDFSIILAESSKLSPSCFWVFSKK